MAATGRSSKRITCSAILRSRTRLEILTGARLVIGKFARFHESAGSRISNTQSIDAALRGEVQAAMIRITPSQVVRMFRSPQRAEMLAFGGKNRESARPGNEDVSV